LKSPRKINAKILVRFLSLHDYEVSRQKGSHIRLSRKDGSHHITIPNHDPIKTGTLHSILNDLSRYLEINKKDLIEKLIP
jgi:predicted RNA binding protein YcfA (HicA-like mRNA interferase family)